MRVFGVNGSCGGGEASLLDIDAQRQVIAPAVNYTPQSSVPDVTNRVLSSKAVGFSPSFIDVSASGAATANFPIFVPPGTAGMEPEISINYNSQAGYGDLGLGWHLSATSVITRVGQNIYSDGGVRAVNFDFGDRFAIDGNRMVVVSGNYGRDDSEYRTEFETFKKITAHGQSGSGPSYFVVEMKDGSTWEYGRTTDSRIEASSNNVVLKWYLNKITDSNGNYIKYNYYEYKALGESRLVSIDYTGNSSMSPYNKVEFQYERVADPRTKYVGGSMITEKVALSKIITSAEGAVARTYSFNYIYDFGTRLSEIVESGQAGAAYNSTVIQWNSNAHYNYFRKHGPIANGQGFCTYGDFDGDGRQDRIDLNYADKTWRLMLYSGQQYLFNQTFSNPYVFGTSFEVVDINNDGRDDLIEVMPSSTSYKNIRIWISRGTGFQSKAVFDCQNVFGSGKGAHEFSIGDFDGDGKIDILFINTSDLQKSLWKIYTCNSTSNTGLELLSSGSGGFLKSSDVCYKSVRGNTITYTCSPLYSHHSSIFLDFNGDGKTDVLYFDPRGKAVLMNFEGSSFSELFAINSLSSEEIVRFSDVNGDGMTDIITKSGVLYSTGQGFRQNLNVKYSNPQGDFNGDGYLDEIQFVHEGALTNVYIRFCIGDNMSEPLFVNSFSGRLRIQKVEDFDGDGIDDIFCTSDATNGSSVADIGVLFLKGFSLTQLVSSITDGLNNTVHFSYAPLTNATIHTKGANSVFPFKDAVPSDYVVNTIRRENGIGGFDHTNYKYAGLKFHLQGRGNLGFSSITVEDATNQLRTTKNYEIDATYIFPYLKSIETKLYSGAMVSSVAVSLAKKEYGNKRVFAYNSQVIENNHLYGTKETATYSYDNHGNMLQSLINHSGIGNSKVVNTFVNAGSWLPSKPSKTVITETVNGKPSISKTISYAYDSKGNLTGSVDWVGTSKPVTTSYQYDAAGMPTRVAVSGSGSTRTNNFGYDSKKRFQLSMVNSLGHSSLASYDAKTGNVLSTTNANGKVTRYEYNGLGQLIKTSFPDGNIINSYLKWASSSPQYSRYYLEEISTSAPGSKIYFDKLGRELRSVTIGFDGQEIYEDVSYNSKGQIASEKKAYYASPSDVIVKSYSYDAYGRVQNINGPLDNVRISYSGLTVEESSPKHYKKQQFNALGQMISVSDRGGSITYEYNSVGNPVKVTTGGLTTVIGYDDVQNQNLLTEPNIGSITYVYNALGELMSQTKNGETTSLTYDVLGRIKTLTEKEGTTTYTYDTRSYGRGNISSIVHSGGAAEHYYYDAYGRVFSKTEVVGGKSYTESVAYNAAGQLSSITYPSDFVVNYVYNARHYLSGVFRGDTNTPIWEAEKMNALGQFEQVKHGNGLRTNQTFRYGFVTSIKTGNVQNWSYQWNLSTGSLEWRNNIRKGLKEEFGYDNLDRLTQIKQNGNPVMSLSYNANGNIGNSSLIGDYTYDQTRKNAVTAVNSPGGNILSKEQLVEYTSFDKVSVILEGSHSAVFTYGVNQERTRMVLSDGTRSVTRVYAHGNYEEESGAVNRKIHYITTGSGASAVYIMTNQTGQMYYLHKDHLGSLDVITNASGAIVEEHSFDAWGRRRNPNNWTYDNMSQNSLLDRGYTGHEHLDQFGLINMNGRVYDPFVARFLSPDRYVQSPDYTQSFNRYSYGFNNPLKYTDPTGWIGANTTGGAGEYNYDGGMAPSWQRNPSQPYWMGLDKGLARATEMTNRGWANYEGARHLGGYYQRHYYSIAYTRTGYDNFLSKFTQETVVEGFHFDSFYWNNGPPGQGGNNLADYVELAGDIGGPIGSGAKNILDNRGAYMPRGQIYKMNKAVTVRTPVVNINTTSKVLNYTRLGGKVLVVGGVVATGYQVGSDISNGDFYSAGARATVFGVAAGVAFIPVVGWGFAIGIGVADFVWGDQFYNWVETKMGD